MGDEEVGALLGRRGLLRGGLAGVVAALTPGALGCTETTVVTGGPGRDGGVPSSLGDGGTQGAPQLRSRIASLGALGAPDSNGIRLPPGVTSRIVARSGRVVSGSSYSWHSAPDGGATFPTTDGGWVYVSNSEASGSGGVGAIRFSQAGEIVDAYSLLSGTDRNCAGGLTPWGTWLSCEETSRGRVYETYPLGDRAAVVRPALGVFKHEAVAVDPDQGYLYLTEDERDGRFYRFVPASRASLTAGTLEVAEVGAGNVIAWREVPDPQYTGSTPTRRQVSSSTAFEGGEGIWYADGQVVFSTKHDNRIWRYTIATSVLDVIYDASAYPSPPLTGVDNVTVSCCGDVLVAEDGGSMQIVAILPDGTPKAIVQVVGQNSSEITGPAFDPSGTRLYFSSQRGTSGSGITYELAGPFHASV